MQPAFRMDRVIDKELQVSFENRLRMNAPLARYTAARVGGPADYLITVENRDELALIVERLWDRGTPFVILGGGSNVLVSDAGVRGVVVLNRSRHVRFDLKSEPPTVWAESGANFGAVARQAAEKALGGLEWAAGIPGTIGGAVVGNAGAHGGDMAGNLLLAEILHRSEQVGRNGKIAAARVSREEWHVERLEYAYRASALKRGHASARVDLASPGNSKLPGQQPESVVLVAVLRLERNDREAVQAKMDEYLVQRRSTQPLGASMGSMFKNPAGDAAGRLIEAAGLKGVRMGKAEISPKHANFFINHGGATAADIWSLICIARERVAEKFGVDMELEIELIGNWEFEAGG